MFVLSRLPGKGRILSRSIQDAIMVQGLAWSVALRENPLPALYSTPVKFRPEPLGALVEEWVDPYTVYERGYGDCDDLVIWRLAEIFATTGFDPTQGFRAAPAHPAVAQVRGTGRYHVLITLGADFEDPARILKERNGELPPKEIRKR